VAEAEEGWGRVWKLDWCIINLKPDRSVKSIRFFLLRNFVFPLLLLTNPNRVILSTKHVNLKDDAGVHDKGLPSHGA